MSDFILMMVIRYVVYLFFIIILNSLKRFKNYKSLTIWLLLPLVLNIVLVNTAYIYSSVILYHFTCFVSDIWFMFFTASKLAFSKTGVRETSQRIAG